MDKWKTVFLTAAIVAAGMFALSARSQPPVSAQGENTPVPEPYRSVRVTGSGSAEATPDMAIVNLGVQTEAETASEAMTQNSEQMQAVLTALTGADIANADIRTSSIQLYPRYESPTEPRDSSQLRVVGYTASNVVEVTVRDLENLGSVLDEVVDAGGNRIQGIRFDVSNQMTALDQAREAAMQDATRKAQQLVGLADAELGRVITITEDSRVPQPFFAAAEMRMADAAVPISPGTQSITVNVQVTWELR